MSASSHTSLKYNLQAPPSGLQPTTILRLDMFDSNSRLPIFFFNEPYQSSASTYSPHHIINENLSCGRCHHHPSLYPIVAPTTTLQNFGPHLILKPPLGVSLNDCTPSGSLREPLGVFASAFLVHFTQVSACWCLSHACDHVLVMLKVFASCVLLVFTMKASVALTHRVIFSVAQVSS